MVSESTHFVAVGTDANLRMGVVAGRKLACMMGGADAGVSRAERVTFRL